MKPIKLILIFISVTIIMIISWVIGNLAGNAITSSTPPAPPDAANTGLIFIAVCAFNAILITMLVGSTQAFAGRRRRITLIVYVFAVQFLLPQMETYFFASEIGIGYDQTTAILIAGAIVSIVTLLLSGIIYDRLIKPATPSKPLTFSFRVDKKLLVTLGLLTLVAYPFIYMSFGYYVAWQNESLRIFYTASPEMASFGHQLAEAFRNGIYVFQIVRGFLWIIVSIPIVVMLKEEPILQFLIVGILSALLPTSLLFIPNPYMPESVAMTHFIETSTSNLIWGCLMVWAIRRNMKDDFKKIPDRQTSREQKTNR